MEGQEHCQWWLLEFTPAEPPDLGRAVPTAFSGIIGECLCPVFSRSFALGWWEAWLDANGSPFFFYPSPPPRPNSDPPPLSRSHPIPHCAVLSRALLSLRCCIVHAIDNVASDFLSSCCRARWVAQGQIDSTSMFRWKMMSDGPVA